MKVCPKCGREFGNSSIRCPICKVDLELMGGARGTSTNAGTGKSTTGRTSAYHKEAAKTEAIQQQRVGPSKKEPEIPSGPSALSIIALIFSLFGCLGFIGAILAIVDLCIKDGKKKVCSILALIFCGIWFAVLVLGSLATSDKYNKKSGYGTEIQEPERGTNTKDQSERSTVTEDQTDYGSDSQVEYEERQTETIPAAEPDLQESYSTSLEFSYDDTYVKYLKHEIVENMAGEKCLAVYYEFTNNSDENQTFMYLFHDKVFQNGVELDGSLFHVNDDSKNSTREIQPGTTVIVVSGFVLSDESSNVTLQIEPMISFTNEKLLELDLAL